MKQITTKSSLVHSSITVFPWGRISIIYVAVHLTYTYVTPMFSRIKLYMPNTYSIDSRSLPISILPHYCNGAIGL